MSAQMTLGLLCGIPVGVVASVTAMWVLRHYRCGRETLAPDFDRDKATLSELDRQAVVDELTKHAATARAQVSSYADTLAGDDHLLRGYLRRFEPVHQPALVKECDE